MCRNPLVLRSPKQHLLAEPQLGLLSAQCEHLLLAAGKIPQLLDDAKSLDGVVQEIAFRVALDGVDVQRRYGGIPHAVRHGLLWGARGGPRRPIGGVAWERPKTGAAVVRTFAPKWAFKAPLWAKILMAPSSARPSLGAPSAGLGPVFEA